MHWADRLFWTAAGLFPLAERGPWLDVPTEPGEVVGADWPIRYAERTGGTAKEEPEGGLLPDFSAIRGPGVDPDVLDPRIADFYERTAAFPLDVGVHWTPGFGLGARMMGALWFHRWGQLSLPSRTAPMTNRIYRLDGSDRCTVWVRRDPATGRVLYVSRYDLVEAPGLDGPGVRVTFPVPGGAWVVIFALRGVGAGLALHEDGGSAGGAGLYLVPHEGPARYVRPLREAIVLRPTEDGVAADHSLWFFGLRFLKLAYAIEAPRRTAL